MGVWIIKAIIELCVVLEPKFLSLVGAYHRMQLILILAASSKSFDSFPKGGQNFVLQKWFALQLPQKVYWTNNSGVAGVLVLVNGKCILLCFDEAVASWNQTIISISLPSSVLIARKGGPVVSLQQTSDRMVIWLNMFKLMIIILYGFCNHFLLFIVAKFIYSKPPGRRMVNMNWFQIYIHFKNTKTHLKKSL